MNGNERSQMDSDPQHSTADDDTVAGERGIPSVNRARSLQARVSNVLAMGLMGALGLGVLSWYFTNFSARQARMHESARSSGEAKAKTEMPLPALGPAPPPPVLERVLGPAPQLPDEDAWQEEFSRPVTSTPNAAAASAKSPQTMALERRLSGPVFVGRSTSAASEGGHPEVTAAAEREGPVDDSLEALLTPTVTPATIARVLPSSRLLLPKGSFIDCTLETALDSTLPGLATCLTASDIFSADGKVVLMERGTKLVGETRGSVRQGQGRIFVLWAQARTPQGVVVELASPGTDELGRSGLSGEVDRHFFERFGAAMLISVIDGVVQSAVQDSTRDATVIYNPSTSQDILTEVLRSTMNIPPTVRKAQGDRIQVLVARDLDFRSVYRLRAMAAQEPARSP